LHLSKVMRSLRTNHDVMRVTRTRAVWIYHLLRDTWLRVFQSHKVQ
jgi:hypothetical protein